MKCLSECLLPVTRANVGCAIVLGYGAFCALYIGSFLLSRHRAVFLHPSALDQHLPEWPGSIAVYLTQFVLLPVALLTEADDGRRSRAFYAMMAATLVSCLIFLVWPTTVGQTVRVGQSWVSGAWNWLYFFDVPGNCFPSLHVALAWVACWLLARRGRLWRTMAPLWWLAISVSTLTTRQHRLIDVGGGIAVALLALWIARPLERKRC